MNTPKYITVSEAKQLIDSDKNNNIILLDVREDDEYKQAHIKSAILKPISSFDINEVLDICQGKKTLIHCRSDIRSTNICVAMLEAAENYCNLDLLVIKGGIIAWNEAGYPIEFK